MTPYGGGAQDAPCCRCRCGRVCRCLPDLSSSEAVTCNRLSLFVRIYRETYHFVFVIRAVRHCQVLNLRLPCKKSGGPKAGRASVGRGCARENETYSPVLHPLRSRTMGSLVPAPPRHKCSEGIKNDAPRTGYQAAGPPCNSAVKYPPPPRRVSQEADAARGTWRPPGKVRRFDAAGWACWNSASCKRTQSCPNALTSRSSGFPQPPPPRLPVLGRERKTTNWIQA